MHTGQHFLPLTITFLNPSHKVFVSCHTTAIREASTMAAVVVPLEGR